MGLLDGLIDSLPDAKGSAPSAKSSSGGGGEIESLLRNKAAEYDIDPDLFVSLAKRESGLRPDAKNPGSTAGGLFQFIDGTWNRYGNKKDKFDPEANADAAARMLRDHLGMFEGDYSKALAAHHVGSGKAAKALTDRGIGDKDVSTQQWLSDIFKGAGRDNPLAKPIGAFADAEAGVGGYDQIRRGQIAQAESDESPVSTSLKRGMKGLTHSAGLAVDNMLGDSEGAAQRIIDKQAFDQANPAPSSVQKFGRDWDELAEDDYSGMFGTILKNPAGSFNMMLEQTPNSLPGMTFQTIAGVAGRGLMAFGPVGAAAGLALQSAAALAGNFLPEGGAFLEDELHKSGVDTNDVRAMTKWIEEHRGENFKGGATKAGVISAVDGVTGWMGMKMLAGPSVRFAKAEKDFFTKNGVNVADSAALQAARASDAYKTALQPFAADLVKASEGFGMLKRGVGATALDAMGEGVGEYAGSYAATGDASIKDAVLEGVMGVGQGAAMAGAQYGIGKMSGPDQAMEELRKLATANIAPAEAKPNSPLSNAAQAAQAADPITEALKPISERFADRTLYDQIRSHPNLGPDAMNQILSAYRVATNTNMDPMARQAAVERLGEFFRLFDNQPNFTAGKTDISGVPAVVGNQSSAVGPADPRVGAIDGEASRVAQNQRQGVLAKPVQALATDERARKAAEAEYEAAYQDLVKAEQLGVGDQELMQRQLAVRNAEIRLQEINEAVEANRIKETAEKRDSLLGRVLASNPENPNRAFDRALRLEGFRDATFTEEEKAKIARFNELRSIQEDGVSAAPNEAGDFGIKEKRPSASAGRYQHIADMLSSGWQLANKHQLTGPNGETYNLKGAGEAQFVRNKLNQKAGNGNQPPRGGSQGGTDQGDFGVGGAGANGPVPQGGGNGSGQANAIPDTGAPAGAIQSSEAVGNGGQSNNPLARSRLTALDDTRIAKYADELRSMAPDSGWAEEGGRLLIAPDGTKSRTKWIPRAEWFIAGMLNSPQESVAAVEKAISGQPMRKAEKLHVQGMMDFLDMQHGIDGESHAEQLATLSDIAYEGESADAQNIIDTLGDVDLESNGAWGDEVESMRALGFTEEEINEITRRKQGAFGAVGEEASGVPAGETQGAIPEGDGNGDGQAEGQEGFSLSQQTNQQAADEYRQQQEEASQKDERPAEQGVTADQGDLFNTQGTLFNSNRDGGKPTFSQFRKSPYQLRVGDTLIHDGLEYTIKSGNDSGVVAERIVDRHQTSVRTFQRGDELHRARYRALYGEIEQSELPENSHGMSVRKILRDTKAGVREVHEVDAQDVSISELPNHQFFVFKDDESGAYSLTEASTGFRVGVGETAESAIADFKGKLEKIGADTFAKRVADSPKIQSEERTKPVEPKLRTRADEEGFAETEQKLSDELGIDVKKLREKADKASEDRQEFPVNIDVNSFVAKFPEFDGYGISSIRMKKDGDIDVVSTHTLDGLALQKYTYKQFLDAYKSGEVKAADVTPANEGDIKQGAENKGPTVKTLMTDGTFKRWQRAVPSLGKVNGWTLFKDELDGERYVLMTSYNSVGFDTEQAARDWAKDNKAVKGDFNERDEVAVRERLEEMSADDVVALAKAMGITGKHYGTQNIGLAIIDQKAPKEIIAAIDAMASEPNLAAAKALIQEAKDTHGDKRKEAIVRKKARELAQKTPLSDEKTVLALDMVSTRLGMGDGGTKALEFLPSVDGEQNKPASVSGKAGIDSWRSEFESAKKDGDKAKIQALYDKVRIVLNGIAQSHGDKAVSDFNALKKEIEQYAKNQQESAADEQEAGGDAEKLGDLIDYERFVLISADDISKLRKIDVERVLEQGAVKEFRQEFADWIKAKRPDLAQEVDAVMADIAPTDALSTPSAETKSDDLTKEMAGFSAVSDAEYALRNLAHADRQDGDIGLGNGKFVTLAQAVSAAKQHMDPADWGKPFQFNRVLDIAPIDWNTMVDAMKKWAASQQKTDSAKKGQEQAAPVSQPENDKPAYADDAELQDALSHLGDVLGDVFGAKLNITGKQYGASDLLPAMSKVIELLIKKGFKSFRESVGAATNAMRGNANTKGFVDQITPRQWKAAYNSVAEFHEGTESEEDVAKYSAEQIQKIIALPEKIKEAEQATNHDATPGQKEAGNYAKGKFAWHGLNIAVETAKGEDRTDKETNGDKWRVTMPATYGYVLGSEGADGDHVDVFMGDKPESQRVYVINQTKPGSAEFDEHKVMLGYDSEGAAISDYLLSFSGTFGGSVLGSVSGPYAIDDFKHMLESNRFSRAKPISDRLAYVNPRIEEKSADDLKVGDSLRYKGKSDWWMGGTVLIKPGDVVTVQGFYNQFANLSNGKQIEKASINSYFDKVDGAEQASKPAEQLAPGTRINGAKEKAAADRLAQLLDKIDQVRIDRNTPEGSAKGIVRSVIEELRKERTAVSVVELLETASSRLLRQHTPFSDVIDQVAESLSGDVSPIDQGDIKQAPVSLDKFGLTVRRSQTKNGTPTWEVSGNTRDHVATLRNAGGKWYGPKKVWSFYSEESPESKILAALGAMPRPAEVSLSEIEVERKSEGTGRIKTYKQRADEALSEIDERMGLGKQLLECLNS